MKRSVSSAEKCNYLPEWFLTYLRGFRFSREWVKVWQDEDRHLHIEFEGLWADTILLEVKVLAIISELFYMFNDQAQEFDYQELYDKTYHKTERLLEAGCVFSDFGTRRRASLTAEDTAVRAMRIAMTVANGKDALLEQAIFILP